MAKKSREPRNTNVRQCKVERCFNPPSPLKPKNTLQAEYIDSIQNNTITIATGYPGTGKTYIAARIAASWYKQKRIDQIILTRPAISESASLGFFKGTLEEKMQGWLAPVLGALKEEFSPGELEYLVKETVNRVTYVPLEIIKGSNWKNCFTIVDEAEDCTLTELKAILTRVGTNSRLVLSGDIGQSALYKCGLYDVLEMKAVDERFGRHIQHVNFNDPAAIVRSNECREMILGFERAGK